MKENEFLDGVSNVDPDVVERFVSMDNKLQKKAKNKGIFLRFGAIAACLALIVGAVIVVPMLRKDEPVDVIPPVITMGDDETGGVNSPDLTTGNDETGVVTPPVAPTWDNAHYSADQIADLFDSHKIDAVTTNAYQKVYVPNSEYLYIDDMTNGDYLDIYQYLDIIQPLSKTELQLFADPILPRLAAAVNASVPQYNVEKTNYSFGRNSLYARTDIGSYNISLSQNDLVNSIGLGNLNRGGTLKLDRETIRIDQRLSNEEIISSLQSIKNKLFEIFGVSFPDAKVVRYFGAYSKNGAEFIYIYFYDESAHSLNSSDTKPLSDYICISFDNFSNYAGDIVSSDILDQSSVRYAKYRSDANDLYSLAAKAKKIPLSDAEALLYNGYVFGGHSCPLCMSAQDKISFSDYDFVGYEYVFGMDYETDVPTLGIPFYVFYKKIGTAENGNTVYAKTYVPAIEVSGYKEYFESQKDNHRSNWGVDEVG